MFVSDGSGYRVTENESAPPAQGLGLLHPLLSVAFTVMFHVSALERGPTRQEYVDVTDPDADPEQ
jgi:hypothetical protein